MYATYHIAMAGVLGPTPFGQRSHTQVQSHSQPQHLGGLTPEGVGCQPTPSGRGEPAQKLQSGVQASALRCTNNAEVPLPCTSALLRIIDNNIEATGGAALLCTMVDAWHQLRSWIKFSAPPSPICCEAAADGRKGPHTPTTTSTGRPLPSRKKARKTASRGCS
jgi:hypothetical protein